AELGVGAVSAPHGGTQRSCLEHSPPCAGDMTHHGRQEREDRETYPAAPGERPQGGTVCLRQGIHLGAAIHGVPRLIGKGWCTMAGAIPANHTLALPARLLRRTAPQRPHPCGLADLLAAHSAACAGRGGNRRIDAVYPAARYTIRVQPEKAGAGLRPLESAQEIAGASQAEPARPGTSPLPPAALFVGG